MPQNYNRKKKKKKVSNPNLSNMDENQITDDISKKQQELYVKAIIFLIVILSSFIVIIVINTPLDFFTGGNSDNGDNNGDGNPPEYEFDYSIINIADSERIFFDDYQGKILVLIFTDADNSDCNTVVDNLMSTYQSIGSENLAIFLLDTGGRTRAVLNEYTNIHGISFIVAQNGGTIANYLPTLIVEYPSVAILDENGDFIKKLVGVKTVETFTTEIDNAIDNIAD